MIRAAMLGLLGLLALTASAASAPVDWTRTASYTQQGGIRVGNPRARVSFVEIANYTCPHCAHFSQAGGTTLARQIRSGALAVEFRPLINNELGLAATLVARCAAPGPFLAVNEALYARQDQWFARAAAYADDRASELSTYTELARLQQIAQEGGIAGVAVGAGLAPARIAACFDRARLDNTLRAVAAAGQVTNSTPTFLLGRDKLEGETWATFSGRLRAAGLK